MREAEGLSGCCRLGQATPRTHLAESPPRTKSRQCDEFALLASIRKRPEAAPSC